MVQEDIGSIFRRSDGKYFVYIPQAVAEDTGFPFRISSSVKVKVRFTKDGKLVIESANE